MDSAQSSLFDDCVQVEPGKDPAESVSKLPHCKGVILFSDASDAPILPLIAADIKRLAHNRLTCADATVATRRVKLSEIVAKIYYACCWCDFNANLQHYRIAKDIFPLRYTDFVTLAKTWYVKINLAAKWPYFSITDNPQVAKDVHVFGPFPSRKVAGDYIDSLNETFALCRHQCLIDDPQKAASCPYYQMHICGAPCAGKMSREEYLHHISDAVDAAGGNRSLHIIKLQDSMRTLSAKMEFEQAQIAKKQIEHLKQLDDGKYKWVCDIHDLQLLHIDAGPKIKIKGQKKKVETFLAFLVLMGNVRRLDNFTIEQIPLLLENVKSQIANFKSEPSANIAEQMSLVGLSLYRSKTSGLWLDFRNLPSAAELESLINSAFTKDGVENGESVDEN